MDYPTFQGPADGPRIADRFDWTNGQRKKFFDWFLKVVDERVNGLTQYLGVETPFAGDGSELVRVVGLATAKTINQPEPNQFVARRQDEKRVVSGGQEIVTGLAGDLILSERGWALAVDLGILVALATIKQCAELHWDIQKARGREVAKNLPILVGFGQSWDYFCPLLGAPGILLSIAKSKADDASAWVRLFKDITSRVRKI